MFLKRREWVLYSFVTLASFGVTVFAAFYGGFWASLQFLWGCLWAWNLLRWAAMRAERRRGYRVESRRGTDGEIELRLFTGGRMKIAEHGMEDE